MMSRHPKNSLMGIPVELRQLIYSFLVPNKAENTSGLITNIDANCGCVIGFEQEHERYDHVFMPSRHDGGRCHVALLRTNRQIFHEMVEILYSSIPHRMGIKCWGCYSFLFLNRNFPSVSRLPFGFRFVKDLDLGVEVIST